MNEYGQRRSHDVRVLSRLNFGSAPDRHLRKTARATKILGSDYQSRRVSCLVCAVVLRSFGGVRSTGPHKL